MPLIFLENATKLKSFAFNKKITLILKKNAPSLILKLPLNKKNWPQNKDSRLHKIAKLKKAP